MKESYQFLTFIIITTLSPVFAGLGLGADVNYLSMAQASSTSGRPTTTTDYSGYVVSPFLRYNVHLNKLLTFSAGAHIGFGSLNPLQIPSAYTSDVASLFRFGGDVIFTLDSSADIKPYVRGTFGKDYFEEAATARTTPESVITIQYGAIQWSALFGIKLCFNDVLSLYVQGGISGSPSSDVTAKSITGPIGATTTVNALNALGGRVSYTGLTLGGGFAFDF